MSVAQKSNLMSKFAEIESADEEESDSDSYETDWTKSNVKYDSNQNEMTLPPNIFYPKSINHLFQFWNTSNHFI